jgi:hypothetical protein
VEVAVGDGGIVGVGWGVWVDVGGGVGGGGDGVTRAQAKVSNKTNGNQNARWSFMLGYSWPQGNCVGGAEGGP